MKKLISIIASLSLAATMVAPVFAAELANNNPVIETTFVEITAEQFEQDWVGEALPDGHKAYLVDVNMTGLDLSNACAGTTNVLKKKRTGVLLMAAGYGIDFDSKENIGAVYTMDGVAGGHTDPTTVEAGFLATKSTEGLPTIADGAAATTATDVFVYQFVITTKGTVTGTTRGSGKITVVTSDAQGESLTLYKEDLSYTVNGVETNAITFGATEEPEEPKDIIISDPMNLVTENGDIGTAWDVTINNFDDAADYVAIFTDVDDNTTRDGGQVIKFVAEVKDGSIAFATILNQSQARNVSLNIEKK